MLLFINGGVILKLIQIKVQGSTFAAQVPVLSASSVSLFPHLMDVIVYFYGTVFNCIYVEDTFVSLIGAAIKVTLWS